MDLITPYSQLIKNTLSHHPSFALQLIKLGLSYEYTRLSTFPSKQLPHAYQKLNQLAVKNLLTTLNHPESCVWANIFSPVEIFQNFHLNTLSIECFSSFMAGFKCEDAFIDLAEKDGIAETLCSYHKAFLGAGSTHLLPKPQIAITTSTACDGNINTFRHLSTAHHLPLYILDIPSEYSKDSEGYVVEQLQEMIHMLEDLNHRHFNIEELKQTLHRENLSKSYFNRFLKLQATHYYPSTMAIQLFLLFTSHLTIGTKETLDFYKLLYEDIKHYPKQRGLKILWVHLMPYYHKLLQSYFNLNPSFQIQTYDLNLDYTPSLDCNTPLESLAKKMILNLYNGSYMRKAEFATSLAKSFNVDAAIHFCHWGCKQSSGGVMLLKEQLASAHIPLLILDGDALDKRNCPEGQIKTRLEAFLEMLQKQKEGESHDCLCL